MQNNIELDYIWEEWNIKCRKDLINTIQNASEQQIKNIAIEQELINIFLLKRNWDIGLRNHVYSKLEENKQVFEKVKKAWLKIISKTIDKKNLSNNFPKEKVREHRIFQTDSLKEIINKIKNVNDRTIKYFKKRLKKYQEENDLVSAWATEYLINEYSSGIFRISDFIAKPFIYEKNSRPQKYHFICNSFLILNLKNYMVYWELGSGISTELSEFAELLAKNFYKKIYNLLIDFLEMSSSIEALLQNTKAIKDLTSIASQIYFESLNRDEKIHLLNRYFGLEYIIEKIRTYEIKLDFFEWNLLIFNLKNGGYINLAVELLRNHYDKYFDDTPEENKFWFLDMLATLYRDLRNYNESFELYKKADKWVSKSINWDNEAFKKLLSFQIVEGAGHSREYRKAIYLKNVGESYGHLGNTREKEKYFIKVQKIASKIIAQKEKFSLYLNLSIASRRLFDFKSERDFLNFAIDFYDPNWDLVEIDYIDERASIFLNEELNYEKLKEIELRENALRFIEFGRKSQKMFNFSESVDFFQKALFLLNNYKNQSIRITILKGIAFSYLF